MINKSIEIYDNTINQTTINILKEIIRQPEETNMYTQHRNPVIDRTKNIECKLGLFIHELLLQINDNTKYLEYWIHTDNKGIGFHRDCDDELLSKNNIDLNIKLGEAEKALLFEAPTAEEKKAVQQVKDTAGDVFKGVEVPFAQLVFHHRIGAGAFG